MVVPALVRGGYVHQTQVVVANRPGGRKHKVDVVATHNGKKFLISLKWQQVGGTAEQKVPFEVISLAEALQKDPVFSSAYLVLGGSGWTLRDFYTGGGLSGYLKNCDRVNIISLEDFIAKANQGKL
jgi:hypothetical protein